MHVSVDIIWLEVTGSKGFQGSKDSEVSQNMPISASIIISYEKPSEPLEPLELLITKKAVHVSLNLMRLP